MTGPRTIAHNLAYFLTYGFLILFLNGCGINLSTAAITPASSAPAYSLAQWARSVISEVSGTLGSSTYNSVAVALDGSIYAAGNLSGNGIYNLGNGVLPQFAYGGPLLTKYDSSGNALWAVGPTSGNSSAAFTTVSVAADGSIYASGYFNGTGTLGFGNGVTVTGVTSSGNLLVVKYNSAGVAQWGKTSVSNPGALFYLTGNGLASDGSLYVAGRVQGAGTYDLGNGVTFAATSSSYSPVLIKYNSSGVPQWARTFSTGSYGGFLNDIAVASDGSIYGTGLVTGTSALNLGNGVSVTPVVASPVNAGSAIIIKYDSSGNTLWANVPTVAPFASSYSGVAVGLDGSIYASGTIGGPGSAYTFNNGVTLAAPVVGAPVIVKFNSAGQAQWAKTIASGPTGLSYSRALVGTNGTLYVCGSGTGSFDFGNGITGSSGKFLVAYDALGNALGTNATTMYSLPGLAASPDGSIYVSGSFYVTGGYSDFGNGVTVTAGVSGYQNLLLLKFKSLY